jgi:hypothetical protein
MKAYEWFGVFQRDGFKLAMVSYMEETQEIIRQRKCATPHAVEGVIREQRQKFATIARRLDIPVYVFDEVLEAVMPAEYKAASKVQADAYLMKQRRIICERSKKAREEAMVEPDPSLRLVKLMAAIFESIELNRELKEMVGND